MLTSTDFPSDVLGLLPGLGVVADLAEELEVLLASAGVTGISFAISSPSFASGDADGGDEADGDVSLEGDEETSDSDTDTEVTMSGYSATEVEVETSVRTITLTVAALSEIVASLAPIDGISLVLNPGTFDISVALADSGIDVSFTLDLAIRFSAELLTPVKTEDGGISYVRDESKDYVDIAIASATVTVTSTGEIGIRTDAGIDISDPVMIGETGIVLVAANVELNLDGTGTRPEGTPDGWKGLLINNAEIRLPNLFTGSFTASGLGFGSSGVSGTIGGTFALTCASGTCSGDLAGSICGLQGGIASISLSLQQNIPSACAIAGQIYLPFFKCDSPIDLSISIANDGSFTIALANTTDGIAHVPVGPLGDLYLNGLAFGALDDGTAYIELSGALDLAEIGGIDLPKVSVNGLRITAAGDISMANGGGITLEQQEVIDLKGFQLEIDAIGFGTEGDKNYVSFSGGIKLTEALPMGVSAKGLQVLWAKAATSAETLDVEVRCEGVGISFEIPDVLSLAGSVSFDNENERFTGRGALILISLDMTINASFIIGKARGAEDAAYRYFGVQLETQLPFGIPLGSTGVALYGFSGLFAHNMAPLTEEGVDGYSFDTDTIAQLALGGEEFDWYQHWYRPADGFYEPWTPQEGAFGFGVGTVFGTQADNGYMIAIDKALVFAFPGPVIMLQGKGNILRARSLLADSSKTPIFTSLILFDGNEKSILAALGMDYMLPAEGAVAEGVILDAHASSEAFFDFDDPSNWHVYLGEEPPEKRIRAEVLKLFEADSYLMLDNAGLRAGVSIGIDKSFDFEVVSAGLKAWLEGEADITWVPQHLAGNVTLDADLWLEAFGFDFSMNAHAGIAAQTPTPKELDVDLEFTLDLPWPFDPVAVEISMRWYEDNDSEPVAPLVKEARMRDYLTTDAWDLTLGTNSLAAATKVEDIEPYLSTGPDALDGGMPLDARPALTFNRNVVDNSGVAADIPGVALEEGGDHRYGYELAAVELHKWDDSAKAWSGPLDLTGYWQETAEDAATMLELYGDGPFSFCRNNTSMASGDPAAAPAYWTPFTDTYVALHGGDGGYPIDLSPSVLDFEDYNVGDTLGTHSLGPVFTGSKSAATVRLDGASIESLPIALSVDTYPTPSSLTVSFPEPVHLEKIRFYGMKTAAGAAVAEVRGTRADGSAVPTTAKFALPNASTEFALPPDFTSVASIVITGRNACLEGFTYVAQQTLDTAASLAETATTLLGPRFCFEPDTIYRLALTANTYTDTNISAFASSSPTATEQRYAFFKTEGPPTELAPYIADEVPATVTAPHYAGYDLTLEFNQTYLRTMYGDDIAVEVVDENGTAVTDASGNAVTFASAWRTSSADAPYTTRVYLGALADAGVRVPGDTSVKNNVLDARITSGNALPGAKRLQARFSYPGYDEPLHTVVFTTSAYADFAAFLGSVRAEAWQEVLDTAPAAAALTDFDAAMAAFGLGQRTLPAQPDVTALYASDLGATVALLLESPEPVEWDRIELSITSAPGTVVQLVNADGTRLLLYAASGAALLPWSAGTHSLSGTYHRSSGDLPELRKGGSASDETSAVSVAIP